MQPHYNSNLINLQNHETFDNNFFSSTNAAKTFSDKYKEFNVDFDQNSNHLESSIEVHKKNYNKYLIKETLREYENFGLLNNAQLNAPNVSADYLKENFEECLDLNLNNSVIFVETNVTDILSQELQGEFNTVDTSLNQHLADMNLPGLTLLAEFKPYVCLICGNNFSRLHDSFRHVRNIHKVLKDFEEHIFEDKNKIILIKQEHTKSLQN
ncbi:hypothetical protein HK099_008278 [Clydaea vesicula]|uniref:C2H2-type domain-containing protein n=1 Tax=Clydaea vesicula TaxID=447962 RepID=A0AAD5TVG3_9FUNG|nr:hypothetical protein HK099_008278 [Clydaea vesicula]